ncbi:cell envelope integrity protein CreD [Lysobacter oculi]|uniref:Cell envelope integrity protein CreD n=1 Tax=Solilutibacter oculi TaxID=2698682 RepID=A0A344J3X4_9GAMM|nr:cell envelope integrity protein CreD [Lysobacter oculi]AXA83734.1 cell envelope integrity protein CreD [Lysobacter oculi]
MKLWLKIAMVGAMTLAILVPLMMVRGVISERQRYRDEAVADIAANIGRAQVLAGPVLVVPYTEVLVRQVQDGAGGTRAVSERREGHWNLFPSTLQADGKLAPDVRKRGLHAVRIYEWQGELKAAFNARIPDDAPAGSERVVGKPFLSWGISDVRGLRGTPVIEVAGQRVRAEQGSGVSATMIKVDTPSDTDRVSAVPAGAMVNTANGPGLHVRLEQAQAGQVLKFDTRLALNLAGTERFAVLPVGASNDLRLRSAWPHPSFSGLLPRHDIRPDGFEAHWQVDALATNAQQLWTQGEWMANGSDIAQVSLLDPINPYLQADRATKYGVLFVVLTFVGFFMFELIKQVAVHPIQYALVGLAIAIFFLLLVSLSEHIAFGWSYVIAAVACIGLIGFYLSAVLKSRARGMAFAGMLAMLYAALYGLLVLEDNALAVGAGLLFAILAAIMVATRKVDWYALGGTRIAPPLPRPQAD